jgi:hypothetical protein
MMCILKGLGFLAFIPATMLLAVSYFVLYSVRLLEKQGLKIFGYCVAALLWISALLIFVTGISLSKPMMPLMHGGMMQGACPGMTMRMQGQEHMGQDMPMPKGCMNKPEEKR